MKRFFVYLARTRDGAYYCGYAVDVPARLASHNAGTGAKILRGKRPVSLAYAREFSTRAAALSFEATLKKRTHAYKRMLATRWCRKSVKTAGGP
ncbi:MAG: GIY-YIG nuclease family protein [Candidatus Eremiobacteraeota bacterium]|nr:GIY-YIG nuclease family protein [Candidatus Eremiobacteraeota bacterium]MBC5827025.1 GIY-YIG nuclease family protein [Candidatus Eremiobacteraeota bacterium]